MTTKVKFSKISQAIKQQIVIGRKESFSRIQLPFGLDKQQLQPLALENGPDKLSFWRESVQTTVCHFENKVSRCMASIRLDLVEDLVKGNVPAHGDCHLVLVVANKQEAYAAGLAAARNWPLYNKKTKPQSERTVFIDFVVENGDAVNTTELQLVAEGVRQTQQLLDMPPSEFNTNEFVQWSRDLVSRLNTSSPLAKVDLKVIQGEELNKLGFGGIYNVGKGAATPPALVVMSCLPENDKDAKSLALVGKGIVYDSGGLSLKGTPNMCGMKHDMGGAGAVFSAFQVIVENKIKRNVHAVLCIAENAIGPNANRNDDILYMYSGKTVEVNNTDAEGRLVLADGVSYASKHLNPALVVDIATLTGAQLITTGVKHAAVLTPSKEIEDLAVGAGKESGDLVFPMLYAPEILMSQFDSTVADMKNSVKDRMNAQSSCAGHFIEAHLDSEYKGDYLHVDIAGPGTQKERGTGFGVALLYEIAKKLK